MLTVGELKQALEGYRDEILVICYTEDEDVVKKKHMFRLFDIQSVDLSHGETVRLDDLQRTVSITFGRTADSQDLVTLNITSDF